jgi:voltage-gated potassium channel
MRERIHKLLFESDTRAGRKFDYFIQSLIVLSLISFAIETLPNLPMSLRFSLAGFEVFVIFIFTLEYALRIYAAKDRWGYIFSFFGLVDLIAILPFYMVFALDLRVVRAFRILRVFRVLKLVRFNRAVERYKMAYSIVKEELALFFVVTGILTYLAAAGIHFFEHEAQPEQFQSIFHSFWWAIVTITTVGYGDVYPITLGGRIFTLFILIAGVGVVTVPAGLVASALSKAREVQSEKVETPEKSEN